MSASHSYCFIAACVLCLLRASPTRGSLGSDIEAVTGNRTRIVWARCVAGQCDADVQTANFALIGFDSRIGAEQVVVKGPSSCANPWITPDGSAVVFSDVPKNEVLLAGWNGENRRKLVDGYGLCVWADPVTGLQWVYASDKPYGTRVDRYRIDNTQIHELVWDRTPVSIRFRVSADGTRAGGEFPWNKAGIATLPNQTFTQLGSGCNAMLAPDNSYRFFHMVGTHREIHFYDFGSNESRIIRLDTAPGVEGGTVWIPKWSNDVRFFTMAAPGAKDSVRHNIYLGAFNHDFSAVDSWVRITDNPDTFEVYAYAWIGTDPQIQFQPVGLQFSIDQSGSGVRQKTVMVTSHTPLPQSLNVTPGAAWLSVSKTTTADTLVLTNTIDVQGLAPGIYSTVVSVSGNGVAPTGCPVEVRIDGTRRLASIIVFPADATIFGADTVRFNAQPRDQFGDPFTASVTWRCTPAGATIDTAGLFAAGGTRGTYAVIARAMPDTAVACTATVSVYNDISVHSPSAGAVYETGASMCIRWDADTSIVHGVAIHLSLDAGVNWIPLTADRAVTVEDTMWGNYCLVVPDSFSSAGMMVPAVSQHCRIRVCNYPNGPGEAVTEGDFVIRPPLSRRPFSRRSVRRAPSFGISPSGRLIVRVDGQEYDVYVFDASGAIRAAASGTGPSVLAIADWRPQNGVYLVKLASPEATSFHRVVVVR